MAVELAKVALWLHTFTVGAPLSFLDHHLRCGDSLFGEFVHGVESYLLERGNMFIGSELSKAKQTAKGMAMIEGSTVGIGFEIQVGDIVQPAYDYVDFFWRAFLYAFMVLGFYKLLLGIVVVGIGFVLFGVGIIGRTPHIDLRRWGRRCVLIGILVAYVVPLSLIMTELLSDRYTSTIKEKHAETIDGFHSEVEASALEFLALKNQISILQPGKTIDDLQAGMLRIVTSIGKTFRLSLLAFLYYVLILLFELLFFPLLSAVILYKFTVIRPRTRLRCAQTARTHARPPTRHALARIAHPARGEARSFARYRVPW